VSPTAAYRDLVARDRAGGVWRMLERPLLIVLLIGTMVPIMAVQRATLGLVAASALAWSFVVVIQMATGAALIASSRSRTVSMPRALELWFAGHVPYSVWLAVMTAVMATLSAGAIDMLVVSALVPAIWTSAIVSAFCRTVLNTSAGGARWRATTQFVLMWALSLQLVALTAGGWFQVIGPVARLFE
jgi:hypothetical protein